MFELEASSSSSSYVSQSYLNICKHSTRHLRTSTTIEAKKSDEILLDYIDLQKKI